MKSAADPLPQTGDGTSTPDAKINPDVRSALWWSVRGSIAVEIAGSISGIELARGLGLHNRGALAAAMLWPTVAGTLGMLGIEESITFHVAREPQPARPHRRQRIVALLASVPWDSATHGGHRAVAAGRQGFGVVGSALIYTLYIPLNMFAVALTAVLNGLHRYAWCNKARIIVALRSSPRRLFCW